MPSRRRYANRLPASSTPARHQPAIPAFIDSSIVAPRANLRGDAATARMADDMRLASQREGGITRDDLELLGWTADQVTAIAGKARTRAQQLSGASL